MEFLKLAGIDANLISDVGRLRKMESNNKVLNEENKISKDKNEVLKERVIEESLKIEYLQDVLESLNKKLTISEKQMTDIEKDNNENMNELKLQLVKYSETLNILEKNDQNYVNQIEHLEEESDKNIKMIKRLETRIKTLDTQKTRLNNKMHKLLIGY